MPAELNQKSEVVSAAITAPWDLWGWAFLSSFVAVGSLLWLAGLRYKRMPDGTHWTERARALFPVRTSFALMSVWVPLGIVLASRGDWPMEVWPSLGLALTGWLGCLSGEWAGMAGLKLPPAADRPRIGIRVARGMLFMPEVVVLLALMFRNTDRPLNWETVGITLLGCGLLLAWQMGLCVQVCLWCRIMKPVNQEIREMVDGMSAKLGIPVRRVFEMELGMWNAFALIWTRDMAFTTGLLHGLTRAELEAVTAHELGHLAEGPRMRWMRMSRIIPLGLIALFPALVVSFGLLAGFLVMAAAFQGSRYLGKWLRRAEVDADAVAVGMEFDAGCYSKTLERIYEANLVPAVLSQRSTHPDLYDRMVEAGVTPDFPRPLPGSKLPAIVLALLAAATAAVIFMNAIPEPPAKRLGLIQEPGIHKNS